MFSFLMMYYFFTSIRFSHFLQFFLTEHVFFISQDKTQMTMIVMWLIELYLNHLNQLREQDNANEYLVDEFRNFLSQSAVKVQFG